MTSVNLTLRWFDKLTIPVPPMQSREAATAWFIPGADASTWLEELSRWGVALPNVKLYPLPQSRAARSAGGVLVICPSAPGASLAERYIRVGARLYIPAGARPEPAASPSELDALLPYEVSIFHPSIGLVGFRADDALKPADLLEIPARRETRWNRARPGAFAYARLVSVAPDVKISLDDLMEAARGDIGANAGELPPEPEPENINPIAGKAVSTAMRAAAGAAGAIEKAAGAIGKFLGISGGAAGPTTGQPNAGGGGRGILSAFQQWARSIADRYSRNNQLDGARNRELERLMEMLDKDPETGLGYAIPLGGKGQFRGVGKPGANLVRRKVDFDLGRARGGAGAADFWSVPDKLRAALREKYIAAANRELALGRFRRAAYIFAELLGDHSAAANALMQGRHFREAAVIYRDVLNNKGRAAQCLEEGGLILEAIELRIELKQWMDVARLYETIERFEDARNAYRQVVEQHLQRKDLEGAAQILTERMGEHDEALQVLASGWPDSMQAEKCLKAQFGLLGRLGRHAQTLTVIQTLRGAQLSEWCAQYAVETCSSLSNQYPDAKVRVKAADMARVIAGKRIAQANSDRVQAMAAAVTALAPEDRLLARDATRYFELRKTAARKIAPPPSITVRASKPQMIRSMGLGRNLLWSGATMSGDEFFAVGSVVTDNSRPGLMVARGRWSGEVLFAGWPGVREMPEGIPLKIETARNSSQVAIVACQRINARTVAGAGASQKVTIGTPDWLPATVVGFCYDERGAAHVVRKEGEDSSLDIYSVDGHMTAQFPLPHLSATLRPWLPIAARHQRIFVSNGESWLISLYDGKSGVTDLGRPIRALAASHPFTRLRIAIAHDEGGVVLWPDSSDRKQCRFGQGMIDPVIGFTRNGDLIAATASEVRVYRTDSASLTIACSINGPNAEPYAVLPAGGVDEYALFLKNGDVQIWRA